MAEAKPSQSLNGIPDIHSVQLSLLERAIEIEVNPVGPFPEVVARVSREVADNPELLARYASNLASLKAMRPLESTPVPVQKPLPSAFAAAVLRMANASKTRSAKPQ